MLAVVWRWRVTMSQWNTCRSWSHQVRCLSPVTTPSQHWPVVHICLQTPRISRCSDTVHDCLHDCLLIVHLSNTLFHYHDPTQLIIPRLTEVRCLFLLFTNKLESIGEATFKNKCVTVTSVGKFTGHMFIKVTCYWYWFLKVVRPLGVTCYNQTRLSG